MISLLVAACAVGPTIADYDLQSGLPPADTGLRVVYSPSDYSGTDYQKVQQAVWDAEKVDGAVVLDRVYETTARIFIRHPIMLTGGGLRRACQPDVVLAQDAAPGDLCVTVDGSGLDYGDTVAAVSGPAWADTISQHLVWSASPNEVCFFAPVGALLPAGTRLARIHTLVQFDNSYPFQQGFVVDSVLLDGNNRCAGYTHDWRLNNAIAMRGQHVIRDSVIYDSPSESITSCGARIEGNVGLDLQGSLSHKSCPYWPNHPDLVIGNYVDGVNLATDAVMQHSEGVLTPSANAGSVSTANNVFRDGRESVFGVVSPTTENLFAAGDCYESIDKGILSTYGSPDPSRFFFDVQVFP